MKNFYYLLFLISTINLYAQNNCDNANAYLVSAYSHVKTSYEANNVSHLKYAAHRSLESINLAKKTLADCNCSKALEQANKALEVLAKVDDQPTYEDGRYFVKRAKEFCQQSVIEMDKCATSSYSMQVVEEENTADSNDLASLKNEQAALLAQQEALKRKEAEIKRQLAEQKEKELLLKKQQLVVSYEKVIDLNIKTYNETLKSCNCGHQTIIKSSDSANTSDMSTEALKEYYTNQLKTLAKAYLAELDSCKL
ncbi:hypothetical protein [Aestuariibaculum suncheonense]|uniref:Uncharacterized protein n=1 Tax=Aestuariibaculum suncheonense TaxID=1028745 RepID=A0A8J6QG10_9FLAO|nr:hypothetical protein [Aestuariibaculum suncheonense]MBD0834891.1 hypothetical protein [Aestuariibaculum suncheonense]